VLAAERGAVGDVVRPLGLLTKTAVPANGVLKFPTNEGLSVRVIAADVTEVEGSLVTPGIWRPTAAFAVGQYTADVEYSINPERAEDRISRWCQPSSSTRVSFTSRFRLPSFLPTSRRWCAARGVPQRLTTRRVRVSVNRSACRWRSTLNTSSTFTSTETGTISSHTCHGVRLARLLGARAGRLATDRVETRENMILVTCVRCHRRRVDSRRELRAEKSTHACHRIGGRLVLGRRK
jgi:hypothetical protein